jgi:hypothetical protein
LVENPVGFFDIWILLPHVHMGDIIRKALKRTSYELKCQKAFEEKVVQLLVFP